MLLIQKSHTTQVKEKKKKKRHKRHKMKFLPKIILASLATSALAAPRQQTEEEVRGICNSYCNGDKLKNQFTEDDAVPLGLTHLNCECVPTPSTPTIAKGKTSTYLPPPITGTDTSAETVLVIVDRVDVDTPVIVVDPVVPTPTTVIITDPISTVQEESSSGSTQLVASIVTALAIMGL